MLMCNTKYRTMKITNQKFVGNNSESNSCGPGYISQSRLDY